MKQVTDIKDLIVQLIIDNTIDSTDMEYIISKANLKPINNKAEVGTRLRKKDLQSIYKVDRSTIESWIKNNQLPMIEISTHCKYIREEDLLEWEKSKMKNINQ